MGTEAKKGDWKMLIKRGDIYYADLSPVVGSEQGGLRPVLIIQNDIGNRYSPTVIAAAITSRMGKTKLPTHIDVYADRVGLARDSVILLEQIRTLDKRRLKEKMGHLDERVMKEVNSAIAVSFGLDDPYAHTRERVVHPLPEMPAAAAAQIPRTETPPSRQPAGTAGVPPQPAVAAGGHGAPAAAKRQIPSRPGSPGEAITAFSAVVPPVGTGSSEPMGGGTDSTGVVSAETKSSTT